jgi:hypothetical protein
MQNSKPFYSLNTLPEMPKLMFIDINIGAIMRTTVTIDDDLYNKALEMADPAIPEIPRNRAKR